MTGSVGGGINSVGNLNVDQMWIDSHLGYGGIWHGEGSLLVSNSTISDNENDVHLAGTGYADTRSGGGIRLLPPGHG